MTTPQSTPEDRLANAERALAALTSEIAAIRAEMGGPRPAPMSAPKRERRVSRNLRSSDVERLLGRYGMLAIAVLAAIGAVGTFLSWAISRGYLTLGPGARVLLGLAFAAGVGVWGLKLRRTERSFGSSLVGLALVIVLVCAYAAGPGFHLVPAWVAFIGSTGISWALAIFARAEDDEPLWCVAFGGGTIAPFATSDGRGNLYALLAYALILLLAACFAIRHRAWPVAWRVFYLASALFCLSSASLADSHGAWGIAAAFALPIVVGAGGVAPFAPDSRKRAALRWLAFVAVLVTFMFDRGWAATEAWLLAAEIMMAVALWLLMVDRLRGVVQSSLFVRTAAKPRLLDWIDSAVIPLLLVSRPATIGAPHVSTVAVYGIAVAMFIAAVWRLAVGSARDASAFAVIAAGAVVLLELSLPMPLARVSAFLGLAVAALLMHKVRPSLSWMTMSVGVLTFCVAVTLESLVDRPAYLVPPFSTVHSLTALLVTMTLAAVARFWRSLFDATREALGPGATRRHADDLKVLLDAVMAAPWVWTFVWVLVELAMSYSPSTSTLLLVTYFAATAVASVAAGRLRRSARIRQLGLGLALVAAATSVYGASTYFDIGIRIVAYLVTSAFLLGIAYWYRRPGVVSGMGVEG